MKKRKEISAIVAGFILSLIMISGCMSVSDFRAPETRMDEHEIEMVLVPEGEFIMGMDQDEIGSISNDTTPFRLVYLSEYYIDKYETTNQEYQACVDADVCMSLGRDARGMILYPDKNYVDESPVMYLSWQDASTYCEWRDARLPTEAEWEKAARGTDGRIYAWGNKIDCSYANYGFFDEPRCGDGYIFPIGSYKKNVTPYGAYDMVGNVSEWVQDCYVEDFYTQTNSKMSNPLATGDANCRHILRGGNAMASAKNVQSFRRNIVSFDYRDFWSSVRCVWRP